MRKIVVFFMAFLSAPLWVAAIDMAQSFKGNPQDNTVLIADKVHKDTRHQLLIAEGNVEIARGAKVLFADKVVFHQVSDVVTASGHVRLHEKGDKITFGDYLELTSDFKDGFITQVRMIMDDDALLVANRGKRVDGKETHLYNAVYSPCKVCRVDPKCTPLWQLKSRHSLLQEDQDDVVHTDTVMEMWGIPVFYTPFLSHVAPHVKRRSGFLAPQYGADTLAGTYLVTPYFWALNDQIDVTLTPMLATKSPMLLAQYRQRFTGGEFTFDTSLNQGKKVQRADGTVVEDIKGLRWHVLSKLRYDLNAHVRMGFDVARASDQTYPKRFPILGLHSQTSLITRPFVEGFWGRSYAIAQGYWFQGLRDQDKMATTPLVMPMIDVHMLSRPDSVGGRYRLDVNQLTLTRKQGDEMSRLSTTGGWEMPYLTKNGQLFTLGGHLRADAYSAKQVALTNGPRNQTFRVFPQGYAHWRYPFVTYLGSSRLVAEPLLGVVLSPNAGQSNRIPNEDSRFVEFDDSNLMDTSRFAGLDRLDGGSRFNYGVGLNYYSRFYGNSNFFMGQSLAFQDPRDHLLNTGLDKKFSDIVMRFLYNYKDWFMLRERLLINRSTFADRRNELSTYVGKPILRFQTDFAHLPNLPEDPTDRPGRQVRFMLSSQLTPEWNASLSTTRQLGQGGGNLAHEAIVTYQDECFTFSTTLGKTFYTDRDIRPGTTVMFRVVFKNLGEFSQSYGANDPGKVAAS